MTLVRRRLHYKKTSKLAQKRRKAILVKVGVGVVANLLVVTGIVFLLRMDRITIANISIYGNTTIVERVLKTFIADRISGNYAFVFPKSNALIYPKGGIEAALLESFKEIKATDISLEDLQSISVTVTERKPYALYCGEKAEQNLKKQENTEEQELPESVDNQNCYFLDENGFIFTIAPQFSGNVYLAYYGVLDVSTPIGKQYMSPEEFKEINFFISSLVDIGLKPVVFNKVDENDREIELESGGKILFVGKQSLSDIYENIQSVFSSDEFNESELSTLEYVDFRFGNKVYFKFK